MEPQKQHITGGKGDGQALLRAWRQQREEALTEEQRQQYGAMLRQERRERVAWTQAFEAQKPVLIARECHRLSRTGSDKMSAEERRQEAARLVEVRHQAHLAEDTRDWQTRRDGYLCAIDTPQGPARPEDPLAVRAPMPLTAWHERQIASLSADQRGRFEVLQSRLGKEWHAKLDEHMATQDAHLAAHESRRLDRLLHERGIPKGRGPAIDPRVVQHAERDAATWAREMVQARLAVLQKQQSLAWHAHMDGFLREAARESRSQQELEQAPAADDAVARAFAKVEQQQQQDEERERTGQVRRPRSRLITPGEAHPRWCHGDILTSVAGAGRAPELALLKAWRLAWNREKVREYRRIRRRAGCGLRPGASSRKRY